MKGLSLYGGGLYGYGQAAILAKIQEKNNDSLLKFEFVTATSVGSINACALMSGLNMAKIRDCFVTRAKEIFPPSFRTSELWPFAPQFDDKGINAILQEQFTGTFGELRGHVFITAVSLKTGKLKVFYNKDSKDSCIPTWQIVRMAVAAETYFSPYFDFSDGGIMANNPSMVGVSAVTSKLSLPLNQVELLAINTGGDPVGFLDVFQKEDRRTKGVFDGPSYKLWWGVTILRILLEGGNEPMHEYFVKSLSPFMGKYEKFCFVRPTKKNMADYTIMPDLVKQWELMVEKGVKVVESF
jgi:hypothetical protein